MPTILIIDDDAFLLEMLAELFTGEGYRVLTADDGDQGLRMGRAHLPDLILSDVRMPGTSGHEALAEFRRTPGFDAIPVILMTGNADLPDMRRGMELGADDYLPKPLENAKLLATVRRHLDLSARRRAASTELLTLRRNLGALLPPDLIDPLHEIIGCASVLEVDAGVMSPEDVKEFAHNIISGAETLNRRIENFILFSRLETGVLHVSIDPPGPLHELVRHTAEQVARRHGRYENLRFELMPFDAPFSRALLAKILSELVDNACRYSIKSEPIDLALTTGDTSFTIVIADHGMGIPESVLNAASSVPPDRIGYGLRLAQRLTALLGGSCALDNQPRRGLRVTLTFPRPA